MTKQSYRYRNVRDGAINLVVYQRKSDEGAWQTVSVWMIPQATV